MRFAIRKSNINDLEEIYELHTKCFIKSEHWYKTIIKQYLNDGIVIIVKETSKIVGVLLQGSIIPCDSKDIFESINKEGTNFYDLKYHLKELYGIVMICIDPLYQGNGLGKKLIERHFEYNPKKMLCLHTRKSNNAYYLYKSMGYNHIAYVKDKYYLPNEDSIFMVKYPLSSVL